MKTKPILFSTPVVQAILNGTKTQTRRTQGLEKFNTNPDWYRYDGPLLDDHFNTPTYTHYFEALGIQGDPLEQYIGVESKVKPGDILWVRETFAHTEQLNLHQTDYGFQYVYKADNQPWIDYEGWKWKPSIFMPKEACRLFLKVTDVKVERLQDISESDAIAEGIESFYNKLFKQTRYRDYYDGKRRHRDFDMYPETAKSVGFSHYGGNPWPDWKDPISSFCSLWQSINGKQSWEANPWVWVYKFEQCEMPKTFLS